MAAARRKCLNSPDAFCYICGSFIVPSQRINISDFVNKVYLVTFKLDLEIRTSIGLYIKYASPVLKIYDSGPGESEKN